MAFLNLLGSTAAKLAAQLRQYDIITSDDFNYKEPPTLKATPFGAMTYSYVLVGSEYWYKGYQVEFNFSITGTTGGVASAIIYVELPVAPNEDWNRCGTARVNGQGGHLLVDTLGRVVVGMEGGANFPIGTVNIVGHIRYRAARKR